MSSDRKKVLFLIPSLRGGGAERVVVNLLRNINREKFALSLLVISNKNAAYLNDLPRDVNVIDLNGSRLRWVIFKLLAQVWRESPDVIFSTLGHMNLALGLLRPILPSKIKLIGREACIVSHNLPANNYHKLCIALYRLLYNRFDIIVAQSESMSEDLEKAIGVKKSLLMVIANPVDVQRIKSFAERRQDDEKLESRECVRFVAVGRLSHEKGFDIMLHALSKLSIKDFELVHLGEGEKSSELHELARTIGLADKVRFLGFQDNPYWWIRRADALILPSRTEGFPNVMLESLALGRPVISTPSSGSVFEIAGIVSGCVIADRVHPESLAEAIERWYECRANIVVDDTVSPYLLENIVPLYEKAFS